MCLSCQSRTCSAPQTEALQCHLCYSHSQRHVLVTTLTPQPCHFWLLHTGLQSGAIAIVRLSGSEAFTIAQRVFQPSGRGSFAPESHRIYHGHAVDESGSNIDEVGLTPGQYLVGCAQFPWRSNLHPEEPATKYLQMIPNENDSEQGLKSIVLQSPARAWQR